MAAINYQEPIPTKCKCMLPLMELTSWTLTNPCRRFLFCPNRYKTGAKKCKKFYWYDPELDNEWYKRHLYGMYGQLNPHQIQDIATEISSHEQLIILQDEFAGIQAELALTQKNARLVTFIVLYCWRAKEVVLVYLPLVYQHIKVYVDQAFE
ncbi:hypothetical protein Tco_0893297 [Tanacetum coccineum]|uniref:Zinc finger GRF-type domain-containing protein n=1 Tax=Tanacetum coccineum TaxID=301880 RepID=A0ABQ5C8W5_9ASTR